MFTYNINLFVHVINILNSLNKNISDVVSHNMLLKYLLKLSQNVRHRMVCGTSLTNEGTIPL